ncbi:hypothetical protein ACUY3M_00755 [Corynebacterium suicordis]|uniref:hypothetical protein n=1 Tax=Corynebacterium suicordis TaxID=203264 RepID=UPI00188B5AC0|nr:hypothetical protein [Corynebacterium suicordis]
MSEMSHSTRFLHSRLAKAQVAKTGMTKSGVNATTIPLAAPILEKRAKQEEMWL